MTLAEQWKQEGREEGRQEGERRVLEKLLHLKFGELTPAVLQRLSSGSEQDVSRWTERVLTATSLDEVFPLPGGASGE